MAGALYRHQDSPLTLAEGLEDYRRSQPNLMVAFVPRSSGKAMLEAHDVAHVVFGCSTDLRGEILVHAWTRWGTTQSLLEARRATREAEHRHVFASVGWRALPSLLRALPRVALVAYRARRMHRRWPYRDFAEQLHRPLAELRRHFGIRVVGSPTAKSEPAAQIGK